jgi:hypothetical protein
VSLGCAGLSEEIDDVAQFGKLKSMLADGMSSPRSTVISFRHAISGVGCVPIIEVLVGNVCAEKNFTNAGTFFTISIPWNNSRHLSYYLPKSGWAVRSIRPLRLCSDSMERDSSRIDRIPVGTICFSKASCLFIADNMDALAYEEGQKFH